MKPYLSYPLMTGLCFLFLLVHFTFYGQAQAPQEQTPEVFEVSGYIKDLQTYTFDKNYKDFLAGNLIHNRLNFRYKPNTNLIVGLELRNRIFWSEAILLGPSFIKALRNRHELLNLSATWIDQPELVFHTSIDRGWLRFAKGAFEAQIGRQRINWGIGTIWNPNDIFNTYNFLDFDYEERPGRDALKATYQFTGMSNLELVASFSKESENNVVAFKYFFNVYQYDFQCIGGLYNKTLTLGTGWSGSIGNVGFKGEAQYFAPYLEPSLVNLTAEADVLFGGSWYLNVGLLFNSSGIVKPFETFQSSSLLLSPKQLMPSKWNIAALVNKQFSPIFSGGLTTIYAPGTDFLILIPHFIYNISTNIDIDLVGQCFYAEQKNEFTGMAHSIFLRTKWSF